MTRAVIKLNKDATSAMPILERAIEGCAYSDIVPIAAFRYKKYGVIVNKREILITNCMNEAAAIEVMDFLGEIASNTKDIKKKIKTY